MKLDKIKFAKVVSWISRITNGLEFAEDDLKELDNIIDIKAPTVDINDVNSLLDAMQAGRKIDAIKAYRQLTGQGIKESKDAVEKYWRPIEPATLGDILNKATGRGYVNFDKFEG